MTMQKWGAIAFFVVAVTFVVPALLYFVDPNEARAPFVYHLADFGLGPLWGASLVMAVFTLREQMGAEAPRRMTLALLAATLAAGMLVLAALIRSANREYHLAHPDLNLENATQVLIVWTTLIAGVISAGHHFLGWSLLLTGWAGWTTRLLPRLLSALYVVVGVVALFGYLNPTNDESVSVFGVVLSIWQGIVLWRGDAGAVAASEKRADQPANA